MALYRLRDVVVEYGGRRALDIASLDLPRGGITAFVGPNGSGKTTLLRLLAFLQRPSRGSLSFDGQPVFISDGPDAMRRQVTFVAQSPFLFRRSVRANVAYGLRARGRRDRTPIEAALSAVGLAGFSDRHAWKLSGGEAQRVAIARALAIDPPVYVLDEPTANVDREHVAVIESLIAQLAARGRTVLLSTHNLDQAHRIGTTVLSVVAGRVSAAPLINVMRGVPTTIAGTNYLEADGLRIEIAEERPARLIAIDPNDIVISRAPFASSARNHFRGHIAKVARDERGLLVTIDCGRPLVAHVTQHSYDEMGLNIGMEVWLTFKSSAIHVLGE